MNEWKCIDLKCVRKPTKSRLSLTRYANKAVQQSKLIRWYESPWNQSGKKGKGLWRKWFAQDLFMLNNKITTAHWRLHVYALYKSTLTLTLTLILTNNKFQWVPFYDTACLPNRLADCGEAGGCTHNGWAWELGQMLDGASRATQATPDRTAHRAIGRKTLSPYAAPSRASYSRVNLSTLYPHVRHFSVFLLLRFARSRGLTTRHCDRHYPLPNNKPSHT